ncbi:MAG: SH3 domain-containing protein [Roseiflexaceae bacterium]|nr:SH3 domain-containing protein [Roseiflexaceae bacterium]
MERDSGDPFEPRTPRSLRREQRDTERLNFDDHAEPLNREWRRARISRRPSRSGASFSQELILWLQNDGWKFVLAAIAIVLAGVVLFMLSQAGSPEPLPPRNVASEPQPQIVLTPLPEQPTVTPAPLTSTIALTPTTQVNVQLRVQGTGTLGLFLRPAPNVNNTPIKTLPEGTIVTVVGEDSVQPDRVWKRVRDPEGAEGWAAADYLVPVTP